MVGEEDVGVDRHPKEARGAGQYAEGDSIKSAEGRRSRRPWTVRQVISTSAPPGGT